MEMLNIKFVAKDGKRDEIIDMLNPAMLDQVQKETGTLIYLMATDPDDPAAIYFWMIYADGGFEEHTKSDVDRTVGPMFQPLLESTSVQRLALVGGKGLG
jgi:quinol monooxygenase YgiN